jgi:hypothetical protein
MSMSIARPRSALVCVLALATGCGSTVAIDASGTPVAGGTQGLGVPGATATPGSGLTLPGASTAPGTTGGAPGSVPGVGPVSSGGSGAVPTTSAGNPTVAPAGGGTEPAADGPGVTPDAIYVGITYTVNGDEANAALGATGISQGDTRADAKAVIAEINAHGGVAGRKLVPVWHAYDATSNDTYSDEDQQACADFTQDNHVFAATSTGLTDTFMQCIANSGAVMTNSGTLVNYDEAVHQKYPYYFEAGTATQDRLFGAEVPALVRQKYFTGWNTTLGTPAASTKPKVGVITFSDPNWADPLHSVFLPGLARAGYPVDSQDVVLVSTPSKTSDASALVQQVDAAELKFAQDGVTHVIALDGAGLIQLFFAEAARSQHYYPRYGINSADGAQAFTDGKEIDPQQWNGAVGLGWFPSIDLPAADGNKYATDATKHCLAVMKKRTGQTYSSTNGASIALSYCDSLFMLVDAINKAGPIINRDTVRAAFERMNTSEPSALLPQVQFTPSRHDGADTAFDMYWDPSCGSNGCARYRNPHHM